MWQTNRNDQLIDLNYIDLLQTSGRHLCWAVGSLVFLGVALDDLAHDCLLLLLQGLWME